MSFTVSWNDTCPRCHKSIMRIVFEPHPSNRDLALQSFECGECGPVRTKIISLKAGTQAPELAA
jgi:hypothetical protein